jgi:hypothetical protein
MEKFAHLYPVRFLVEVGFELNASHLQGRHSTTWATRPVHFAMVFLEREFHKLFAWTGLELHSFQS